MRLYDCWLVDYAAGWRKLPYVGSAMQSARASLELAIVKLRRLISARLISVHLNLCTYTRSLTQQLPHFGLKRKPKNRPPIFNSPA
jgi:hypothetical protein